MKISKDNDHFKGLLMSHDLDIFMSGKNLGLSKLLQAISVTEPPGGWLVCGGSSALGPYSLNTQGMQHLRDQTCVRILFSVPASGLSHD